MTRTLKVHGFGEFIAYLPYHLGYRPRDAVVTVGWRGGEVGLCAHIEGAADADFEQSLPALRNGLLATRPEWVALIVYADSGRPPILAPIAAAVRRTGLPIGHLALVEGDQWWAEKCACAGCPRIPTPVPAARGLAAVAQRVLEGAAPLARRADLAEVISRFAPPDAVWSGRVSRARATVAAALAAWLRGTPAPATPGAAPQLVIAVRALHDKRWRDAVLCLLAPQEYPALAELQPWLAALRPALDAGGSWPGQQAVQWTLITSLEQIPELHQPPVLTLIAASAWAHGGGAVSTIAVTRALQIDPGYRLAQLIGELVATGIPALTVQRRIGA